jgi:hypothetical protein
MPKMRKSAKQAIIFVYSSFGCQCCAEKPVLITAEHHSRCFVNPNFTDSAICYFYSAKNAPRRRLSLALQPMIEWLNSDFDQRSNSLKLSYVLIADRIRHTFSDQNQNVKLLSVSI